MRGSLNAATSAQGTRSWAGTGRTGRDGVRRLGVAQPATGPGMSTGAIVVRRVVLGLGAAMLAALCWTPTMQFTGEHAAGLSLALGLTIPVLVAGWGIREVLERRSIEREARLDRERRLAERRMTADRRQVQRCEAELQTLRSENEWLRHGTPATARGRIDLREEPGRGDRY